MNPKALDHFLAGVERRAFRMAMLATRNEPAALDLVQDAMMRLAEKYGSRPEEEWPMLFQRILQNAILDFHRRQKVRRTWITLFSDLSPKGSESEDDQAFEHPLADTADESERQPEALLSRKQTWEQITQAIAQLPARQQQAFLLRYWEGLDISETAQVMGCSEGSVKTHCSRAVAALTKALPHLQSE
ncbi:RNA polymerase sigma factor [beta proteobacterium MWH-UniP1]